MNIVAIIALYLLTSIPAQAESVETARFHPIKSKVSQPGDAYWDREIPAFNMTLPDIPIDLKSTVPGLVKTGTVYRLPNPLSASELTWETVSKGSIARIHLVSDQAKRLRIHLAINQAIPGIRFRLKGNKDIAPLDIIDKSFTGKNEIWLPITQGHSVHLEIFVDETTPPAGLFNIDAVNVIVDDLNSSRISNVFFGNVRSKETSAISAKNLGFVQNTEYDLTCWSSSRQYPALQQAAAGTAKIDFIKNGSSFICSGTLLNDRRQSRIPWFITANHCINNKASARSATFEWFNQAVSCSGQTTDSRNAQTSGGARLLWTNVKNDTSFMRLNALPPAGVSYLGWDSNKLSVGAKVWAVHHPEADHTMVSYGRVSALNVNVVDESGTKYKFNRVNFSYGGVEDGSSGSGLFAVTKGKARWRGALFGGPEDNYKIGVYSNFSSYYPNIKYWLTRK
jgi:lysyl endopeptidase